MPMSDARGHDEQEEKMTFIQSGYRLMAHYGPGQQEAVGDSDTRKDKEDAGILLSALTRRLRRLPMPEPIRTEAMTVLAA